VGRWCRQRRALGWLLAGAFALLPAVALVWAIVARDYPHDMLVHLAPELSGTLTENGRPVAQAEVRLRANGKATYVGSTDEEGNFLVGPLGAHVNRASRSSLAIEDPLFCYVLEFRTAGREPTRIEFTGMGYPEAKRGLDFDLIKLAAKPPRRLYCLDEE
jgi:hypothetical protein